MKVLVKDLPSNSQLKQYYSDYFELNKNPLSVLSVSKTKQSIYIECKYEGDLAYFTPFFMSITAISTKTNTIFMEIASDYYDHVLSNYKSEREYKRKEVETQKSKE